MVLGNEVTKRLDYTLFENNGKHFLVQTKSNQSIIKYNNHEKTYPVHRCTQHSNI
jgi:hypothetical protein